MLHQFDMTGRRRESWHVPPLNGTRTKLHLEGLLSRLFTVAVTRRLPRSCEDRLAKLYDVRFGDDAVTYDARILATHADGANGIIVSPAEIIDAAAIAALPKTVRVISTFSVGFEHIDVAAAEQRGIIVTNTPGVLTEATADLTLLLLLGAARRASEGERLMRTQAWTGWRPTQLLGTELTGKRLGIVGLGRIGLASARRAAAFGMSILYHGRSPSPSAPPGATYYATFDAMLPHCDALSLNCPLTPATRNMLDAGRIALLPRGAIVVNAARGALVVDDALIGALKSGHVAAAGLDVYANEPSLDPRYRELDNTFLMPHLGSATEETRHAMGMLAIDNLAAVLDGKPPPYRVRV